MPSDSEQRAYDELTAWTVSLLDRDFIHQHVVDAWAAQPPTRTAAQSELPSLSSVCTFTWKRDSPDAKCNERTCNWLSRKAAVRDA